MWALQVERLLLFLSAWLHSFFLYWTALAMITDTLLSRRVHMEGGEGPNGK